MKKVDKSETTTLSQRTGDLIIAKKELAYQTKGELIKELQKLQQEYASLKTSYEKDITGRNLAEEVLHASEEKHRALIEQSIDGIVITDKHGNVSVWNKSMESITGIQQCETIGRPLLEIQLRLIPDEQKTPELLGQLRNGLKNILESKMEWPGESREQTIIDVNGTHKVVQDSSFIIKTNNIIYFGTIIRDITEHKQAEEKLRFQANLLENVSEAIIATDMQYNIKFWNKAAEYLYGWTASEVIGHPFQMFIINDYLETSLDVILQKASQDGYWKGEVTQNRRDGVHINIISSLSILTNDINQKLGFISVNRDITERKQAEEEMVHNKKQLEQMVEELNKSHESVAALNTYLEEVRETERALISREIHDQLGQSLTALKIDMTWLREKIAKESEESIKLNEMIELVDATSIDLHRISSELRPLMLDDLGLAATLEWYCEEFANRTGLKVQMEIEDIQTENMDRNLSIYRVAQESFNNIIRHANAKKVQIKLKKIKKDIVLIIQDDGIGISPDKIRSPNSLGLLGMSERVNQSGGHMEILAPAKGGTKVRVYIPMK